MEFGAIYATRFTFGFAFAAKFLTPRVASHFAGSDLLKKQDRSPPYRRRGACALYLGSTLYRIHGTNAPWTSGINVSSDCIRLLNEDVTDLYEHIDVRTMVVAM